MSFINTRKNLAMAHLGQMANECLYFTILWLDSFKVMVASYFCIWLSAIMGQWQLEAAEPPGVSL